MTSDNGIALNTMDTGTGNGQNGENLGQNGQEMVEHNQVEQGSKEEKVHNDPLSYNTWQKILSTPVTKVKLKALLRETLSGLTVSLAQVPEAVAFAFTAGVPPIVGLQAAWIMGLVTGLFGGAPGMISGATGALAVVLPDFVAENGLGYLFIAVLFMGIIQIVFGLIGGGKLVKLIGAPVMEGFANGLAIVIGVAQLHSFKTPPYCTVPCDSPDFEWTACVSEPTGNTTYYDCHGQYLTGGVAAFQAFEVIATMLTVILLPKCTKAFPASLAGIIVGTIIEWAIARQVSIGTPTVEDLASVKGFFPIPVWADSRYNTDIPSLLDAETYKICLPISAQLAMIGLVESLMTMQLVGSITERKPSPFAECLAQGFANVITGIFGGMGGCAMIGQSLINVTSGGITRISSTIAAIFLLLILLVAYPLINLIPVASLAGVMFMVVYFTFEWHSIPVIIACCLPEKVRNHSKIRWVRKIKRTDALIIVLVTIVAVLTNLAIAVGAGVVLAALVFAWDQEKLLDKVVVEPSTTTSDATNGESGFNNGKDDEQGQGDKVQDNQDGATSTSVSDVLELPEHTDLKNVKIYRIKGPVFFASGQKFISLFTPHSDPDVVVLYLDDVVLSDYSALVAINAVARKYHALDKKLYMRKVHPLSMKALKKAHHLIYTYDKSRDDEVNENELLCMELAPRWQADDVPVFPNPYAEEESQNEGKLEPVPSTTSTPATSGGINQQMSFV